jgi:heptosyltransferase-3
MNRILVIRGGAIGDFVLTLPAIKLLRDNFPHAHLEILGYRHIVALAENRFYADAVRSIEYGALAGFFAREATVTSELTSYFRGFDLVVSYLFDPDQVFEENVRRCGVENFLACSPKFGPHEHAAKQLARPLQELGLNLDDSAARLFPSADDRAFADAFLIGASRPIVAIHPGSGGESKNWPAEKWLQLAERFRGSDNAPSLLIAGGEADGQQLAQLRSALPGSSLCFAENLSLPHLAALFEQSSLFLGHDSGISHIAAAVGATCILLFGPSDPAVWAPANAGVRVLRASRGIIADLPVEEVMRAVSSSAPATLPND